MGFVWKWTLSSRTEEEGGAGKSSSLNSSWRDGGAERVVLAVGKALWDLLASWVGAAATVLESPEKLFLEIPL